METPQHGNVSTRKSLKKKRKPLKNWVLRDVCISHRRLTEIAETTIKNSMTLYNHKLGCSDLRYEFRFVICFAFAMLMYFIVLYVFKVT